MTLLTIAEIANRLNISQSTARFYRDKYNLYIPCIGEGRARRYEEEALKGFEIIINGYREKQPATTIINRLQNCYGILTQTTTDSKQQTSAVPLEASEQPLLDFVKTLMLQQQTVINHLQEQVVALQTQMQQQDTERHIQEAELKRDLEERDKKLLAAVQAQSIWKKLFG